MTMFKIMFEAEGVHPLEGGAVRMKYRLDRRHGMPIEPIGVFHLKVARNFWHKLKIYVRLTLEGRRIGRKVRNDPKRLEYTDLALQPGDAIVLYTDGVTEGRRRNDFYGHARLLEVVNGASASATTLVESILADVLQFQAGNPRDDIAVVAIRVPSN